MNPLPDHLTGLDNPSHFRGWKIVVLPHSVDTPLHVISELNYLPLFHHVEQYTNQVASEV